MADLNPSTLLLTPSPTGGPTRRAAPAEPALPRNALRTILYVAARGVAGRSDLSAFQKALPEEDWGALSMAYGWEPLADVLSWARVQTPEVWSLSPLEALRRASTGDPEFLEDLRVFFAGGQDALRPPPDQGLAIPRTELGRRLGKRRWRRTCVAYEDALRLSDGPRERQRFGALIEFDVAAARLREAIDRQHRDVLYEALDPGLVARAVLAKKSEVMARGERFEVIHPVGDPDRVHRLLLQSKLKIAELAQALGVPTSALQRADCGQRSKEMCSFPEADANLARAAQPGAASRASRLRRGGSGGRAGRHSGESSSASSPPGESASSSESTAERSQ